MSKHTPGPWKWDRTWLHPSATDSVQEILEGCDRSDVIRADDYWMEIKPEDARLIAAAPEMLYLISDLLSYREGVGKYDFSGDLDRGIKQLEAFEDIESRAKKIVSDLGA